MAIGGPGERPATAAIADAVAAAAAKRRSSSDDALRRRYLEMLGVRMPPAAGGRAQPVEWGWARLAPHPGDDRFAGALVT